MRILILVPSLGSVMLISVSAATDWSPILIWNASASVPIGLYHVQPGDHLAVADLVVVVPPEPLPRFLAKRDYLPRGVPLLKRVLALPGQTICRNHLAIMIDGVVMSFARERDHHGRTLPVWQGHRMIAEGELFLLNWQSTNSLKDFVVLDELGYLPFAPTGGQLLFNLISQLYERTSIIVMTNLAFGEWPCFCGRQDDQSAAGSVHPPLRHHRDR